MRTIATKLKTVVSRPLWAILTIAALFPQSASAQLVAYEGFEYTEGRLNREGGSGWAPGAWSSSSAAATATAPGLTYGDGVNNLSVVGNRANLAGGNISATRSLPLIFGNTDEIVYVGFLADYVQGTTGYVGLVNSFGGSLIQIGKVSGDVNWGVAIGTTRAASAVPASTPAFIVCRLAYQGTNLLIRMYINPPLAAEPAVSDTGDLAQPIITFNRVQLRVSGSFGLINTSFDEIRIGRAWSDVAAIAGPMNTAPVLDSIADQTIDENTLLTVACSATDPDTPPQTLTYSLSSAPEGMTINPATGIINWTPTEAQGPGVYPVTVTVTDDGNPQESDSKNFSVTVLEVNDESFVQFNETTYPVQEGTGTAIVVTRTGDLSGSVTARISLTDLTARNGEDYVSQQQIDFTLGPGESSRFLVIETTDDDVAELDEEFILSIVKVIGPANKGMPSTTRVIIENDDGPPAGATAFKSFETRPDGAVQFEWTPPAAFYYVQVATSLLGPWRDLPGAGLPLVVGGEESVYDYGDIGNETSGFFRLREQDSSDAVKTNKVTGRVVGPDGEGFPVFVREGDSWNATATDTNGRFTMTGLPLGPVPITFEWVVRILAPGTLQLKSLLVVRIVVMVEIPPGGLEDVEANVDVPEEIVEPPCGCVPLCWIGSVVIGGDYTVIANGFKRGDCDEEAQVTIAGPGGILIQNPKRRQQFTPAASGLWTVTTTVCGTTTVCTLVVP